METEEPGLCLWRVCTGCRPSTARRTPKAGLASLERLAVIHRSDVYLSRNQEVWLCAPLGFCQVVDHVLFSSLVTSHFA